MTDQIRISREVLLATLQAEPEAFRLGWTLAELWAVHSRFPYSGKGWVAIWPVHDRIEATDDGPKKVRHVGRLEKVTADYVQWRTDKHMPWTHVRWSKWELQWAEANPSWQTVRETALRLSESES